MMKTGAVASAGLWVAPSILTLDRASAAVGSCAAPPRRVDFSRFSGTLPSSFLSDDSTVTINFAVANPFGVQDATWNGAVYNGTINGLDNPVITGMNNATGGDYVELQFDFSTPVCPTFFLVDVDRSGGNWEDTVRVIGRTSDGTAVDPVAMNLGGAQTQIDARTVRGNISTSTANGNGAAGNVEVLFGERISRLEIRHSDVTNFFRFQWVGVHDFHWC